MKTLSIIFLTAAAFILTAFSSGAGTVNWGLRPNTQERIPDPPAHGAQILADNNGLFVAPTQENKVYLTFDLGYEAGYTAECLDILRENNIKAIFFLCGGYLGETDLIERMKADGHSIGNHTDKHKDIPKLSDELIKKDITDFRDKFNAKYGNTEMKFFRPPQGRFNEKAVKIAAGENLRTMLWSIAIVDWGKNPIDPTAAAEKITSRLHPGAIILLHISNSGMPKMLRELLPKMAEKGYTAGSWTDL
jgi:peptidoglycan-N-acetylmuramic acid deacetylase